jgi:CheY-like chemotaxis protein
MRKETIKRSLQSLNNDIQLLEEIIEKLNPQHTETQELSIICKRMKEEVCDLLEIRKGIQRIRRINAEMIMKDMRVLLIGNDMQVNEQALELLDRYFVETDIAMTACEAISLYEQEEYDLVVLSLFVDSVQIVEKIREQGERGKQQLIVGLLRTPDYTLQKELQKYGVELILYSPIQPPLLETIFRRDFYNKIEK